VTDPPIEASGVERRGTGGEVTVASPCPRAESEGGDSRSETVGGDTWQAAV
jgi:hypothetical protein